MSPPVTSDINSLAEAPLDRLLVVERVVYSPGQHDGAQRLEELGFLPGEQVLVLRRGWPGGDPLAVRVGHSTFALRRAEASCIRVRLPKE